ncbi:hypothetical protein, partial [Enterococcus faecalis]|uniref:hypothetical protein n=1 Tax=Enterococcus faecalis TaxID=1351 RepID=UPI00403FB3C1
AGIEVHAFNQRTIAGILDMIRLLSALVGEHEAGGRLVDSYVARLDTLKRSGAALTVRPRVYFEEWDEPMISAIGWVSELMEIAG